MKKHTSIKIYKLFFFTRFKFYYSKLHTTQTQAINALISINSINVYRINIQLYTQKSLLLHKTFLLLQSIDEVYFLRISWFFPALPTYIAYKCFACHHREEHYRQFLYIFFFYFYTSTLIQQNRVYVIKLHNKAAARIKHQIPSAGQIYTYIHRLLLTAPCTHAACKIQKYYPKSTHVCWYFSHKQCRVASEYRKIFVIQNCGGGGEA